MDGANVLGSSVYASVDPADWAVTSIGDYNGDGRDNILFTGNDISFMPGCSARAS